MIVYGLHFVGNLLDRDEANDMAELLSNRMAEHPLLQFCVSLMRVRLYYHILVMLSGSDVCSRVRFFVYTGENLPHGRMVCHRIKVGDLLPPGQRAWLPESLIALGMRAADELSLELRYKSRCMKRDKVALVSRTEAAFR